MLSTSGSSFLVLLYYSNVGGASFGRLIMLYEKKYGQAVQYSIYYTRYTK